MKKYIFVMMTGFLLLQFSFLYAQPWKNPLMIARSADGTTFNPPTIFQDSSGVPSVIRWHGDTLIAAFQWFRQPNPSPSWDRVAVKFSYDNGQTWTQPTPIIVNGMPANSQRPFDPALTSFANDSIRIYYSSSAGVPPPGLDSTVNTYSAKSMDGIHYEFEPNAIVDVDSNRVIDPSVIYYNTGWHYASPIGAPQQGAYHFVSPDGINFTNVASIPSDNMHNWTGNYMIESNNELRFYGGSPAGIWYNQSPNGGMWTGYTATNLMGGDPSCLKVDTGNYLIVYVGPPYPNSVESHTKFSDVLQLYPNPASKVITLKIVPEFMNQSFSIIDIAGVQMLQGLMTHESTPIDISGFVNGIYFLRIEKQRHLFSFLKKD